MRRLALGLSLIGCLLVPVTSEALGLGSIDVRTSLNQPLQADIELMGVNSGDLSSVSVKLASPALFARVGIPRPDYLTNLQFKVASTRNGKPVIRVTTSQPLRQPFLDFLLEVNWSGGRLLREYTILLNPPDYMNGRAEASAQMPAAVVAPPAQAMSGKPAAPMTPRPSSGGMAAAKPRASGQPAGAPQRYRVVKGDALWNIARQEGASSAADINKMMVGILRANPQAFIKGNINGLKTGYVLRIPPASQLARIAASEATAEVSKQNALWHQYAMRMAGKTVPESQLKAAGDMSSATGKPAMPGKTAEAGNGHLRIMGTESKSPGMGGEKIAMAGAGDQKAMEHQLSLAKEAAVSNQQQIKDLQSRIDALQGIVTKQQKLLELKNQELAALQAKAGHAGTANAPAKLALPTATTGGKLSMPASATAAHALPAMPVATTAEKPATTAMPHNATAAHPEAVAPAKPAAAPKPPAKPVEPTRTSLVDMLANNPNYLMAAGALALLLLALLWLVVRRSSKAKQTPKVRGLDQPIGAAGAEPSFDSNVVAGGVAAVAAGAATAAVAEQSADREPGGAGDDSEDGVAAQSVSEPDDDLGELPLMDEDAPAENAEAAPADDAMAEADVYIAYGLYPQAESVIQKALEDEPDNANYRSKLLECYYSANDREAFDREAQVLFDSLPNAQNDPTWQRVAALGKSLSPDNNLFSATDTGGLSAEDIVGAKSDLGDLDLGDSHDFGDLGAEGDAPSADADDQVFNLDDLDLGDDLGDDLTEVSVDEADDAKKGQADLAPVEAGATGDADLDNLDALDFSMDDLELPAEPPASSGDQDSADDLDFETLDISSDLSESDEKPQAVAAPAVEDDLDALDFDLDIATGDAMSGIEEPPEKALSTPEAAQSPADDESVLSTASDIDDLDTFGELEDLEFDVDGMDTEPATEGSGLITDGDEVATKLDLAKAYLDMGDEEGAQSTLQEVLAEGSPEQREEAESLLKQIG